MAEFVKPWNDGSGNLSATYDGSGAGDAVFASDVNEGIDREMSVIFSNESGATAERTVKQEGLRQRFVTADGKVFCVAGGGRFGVLKNEKNYTELLYLESSGSQYINLGVVFKNTDEIYIDAMLLNTNSDKFLLAPNQWNNNKNRFGMVGGYDYWGVGYGNTSTTQSNYTPKTSKDKNRHTFTYKDKVFNITDLGLTYKATSVAWGGDTKPLRLFYGYNAACAGRIYAYQHKRDGTMLLDLIPVLDKDGVACMYDKVSKGFFYNSGSGNFTAGHK